jgi:hypothetical protein
MTLLSLSPYPYYEDLAYAVLGQIHLSPFVVCIINYLFLTS